MFYNYVLNNTQVGGGHHFDFLNQKNERKLQWLWLSLRHYQYDSVLSALNIPPFPFLSRLCFLSPLLLHASTMGNLCAILSPPPKPAAKQPANTFPDPPPLSISSNRWSRMRSSRREKPGESLTPEQALEAAAAALYQKRPLNSSLPFDRSTSLRQPAPGKKNRNALPRSSSSRPRSLTDPLLQPHQLVNQVGRDCWTSSFEIDMNDRRFVV